MILLGVAEILICLDLERNASIIREGDLAVKIKRDVEEVDSIILRKYGCLVGPKWSASLRQVVQEAPKSYQVACRK